jgi:hypothetical protein
MGRCDQDSDSMGSKAAARDHVKQGPGNAEKMLAVLLEAYYQTAKNFMKREKNSKAASWFISGNRVEMKMDLAWMRYPIITSSCIL